MRPALPFAIALLASAAGAALADGAPATATAPLKAADGSSAGQALLTEAPGGVLLRIEVKGLAPGWHGLHFHDKGDCSSADFKSAGPHMHGMAAAVHGLLNAGATETGDLPNIHVAADGTGSAEIYSAAVSLHGADGRPALLDADGSAIVIHANPDDHVTQPIGGAGARVACGVISAH
jgi:Cu-Zn family superoxide dismutase